MLKVRDLRVFFKSGSKVVRALDGVSLDVLSGRITAVVGSSGSGKSVLALSMLRLIEKPGWIEGGSIELDGKEILAFGERELRDYRGRGTAMIFQDPSGSMDPVSKVKNHLFEAARTPRLSRGRAMEDFRRILTRVGLKDPEKVLESYPFELSGGMCQRVMVAMGLASRAKVLIADEPTSSLDLTTQAAILEEFRRLRDLGLTMVLITHDLGVVAQTADDVYVLHDGRVIEGGPVEQVLTSPREAFTRSLLVSVSV
ncbi:MAG: ABC transporter ATP-binding protein [Deltaproteobacteria bacterium]|nr:ABC transporter ATP-binding protein [Deltaproteobacteria bacterium]